ncbi:Swt1 family HEPN domain-containing protein [Desulfotomaculum copahuensis]|uniref:Swt1-like HEPN domain-containing protein n=1 Tax=Desulfotomaculum copahuensis TaxID=1838280 RepID=A0A1B7LEJ0_9FIRM|nr:Swt1 family HEPN domain-containing protein [Desulfotomaculum copahuensis]OAT81704.1 hypothetical protein A6M21_09835 [Desulfotomaculum copahuensis]
MSISNHERVGRGLEFLRCGLTPFIARELKSRLTGKNWWKQGVLYALSGSPGVDEALKLDGPEEERLGALDVQALLMVMWNNWNDVFQYKLGHSGRNYVSELREVRNRWAHQQPFTTDDAYRGLDTMTRLLQAVAAEEAQETDKLAHELLRQRYETETKSKLKKTIQAVTETGTTAGLKPWREVITPHPDVASGRYQKAEFAADLAKVVNGEADDEYAEPKEFFRRTFLTEGISMLLTTALKRLSGLDGDPVVQLQTSFGGGKTHTMLALYHLFGGGLSAAGMPGLEPVLNAAGVEKIPRANRAVINGVAFSPSKVHVKPDGTHVHTLWGEIAHQLGGREGYALVAEADRDGVSPGSDSLKELFDHFGPALVLIDEWVAFVRQLYRLQEILPAGSFEANMTFAQALTEGAKRSKNALVVASIPASDIETGGEGGQEALDRLQKTFGRVESSWKPAEADESFEIVRRRLFGQDLDFAARDTVLAAFMKLYQQKGEFPRECSEAAYERRLKSAYPIHPELFDRLYNDWSTLERFQRTRGVLRLMASVIHELWEREDRSLLIMPGTVPLYDQAVRYELTSHLPEKDGWAAVLDTDIDGTGSRPLAMDREIPNLGRYSACRRVARTIFMGSAPAAAAPGQKSRQQGLEEVRIKLGCVQPGESPGTFGDALRRLGEQLTYLYTNEKRYWFDTRPSVNRIAADRAERIDPGYVEEEIVGRLKKIKDRGELAGVHVASPSPGADVPDEQSARLVILRPEFTHGKDARDSRAMLKALEIFTSRSAGPRIYRNMLVFLAPDKNRVPELEQAVRQYLAWQSIKKEREEEKLNLDAFQSRQVDTRIVEMDKTIDARIKETYHWLLVPGQPDGTGPVSWEAIKLVNGSNDSIITRASKRLVRDELLISQWSPVLLKMQLDKYLWKDAPDIEIKKLWAYLSSYCYLPRLKNERVLLDAVRDGICSEDFFAYAAGIDENGRYLGLQMNTGMTTAQIYDSGLLVKVDTARAQIEADQAASERTVTGTPADGYPPDNGKADNVADDGQTVPPPGTGTNGVIPVQPVPPSRPCRFYGTVKLNTARVGRDAGRIAEEIIQHLSTLNGSELEVTLEIHAKVSPGVPEDVEKVVTENCRTLKFKAFGFEES